MYANVSTAPGSLRSYLHYIHNDICRGCLLTYMLLIMYVQLEKYKTFAPIIDHSFWGRGWLSPCLITVNSIKRYRSVKPRRFFSMDSFLRQINKNIYILDFNIFPFKVFKILTLWLCVSVEYLLCLNIKNIKRVDLNFVWTLCFVKELIEKYMNCCILR